MGDKKKFGQIFPKNLDASFILSHFVFVSFCVRNSLTLRKIEKIKKINNKSFSQKFTSKIDNLKNRAYKFSSALVSMEISRRTYTLKFAFSSQSIDAPLSLLLEPLEFYLRFWKKNTFYKNFSGRVRRVNICLHWNV